MRLEIGKKSKLWTQAVCDSWNRLMLNKTFLVILFVALMSGMAAVLYVNEISLILLVLGFFLVLYLKEFRKKREPHYWHLVFVFFVTIALIKSPYAPALVRVLGAVDGYEAFLAPVLALIVLFHMLYNDVEFGVVYLLFTSTLAALVYGGDMVVFLVYAVTGFTAMVLSSNVRRRIDILKVGLVTGIMEALMIIALHGPMPSVWMYLEPFRVGLTNGIVSVVLVLSVSWLFEVVLGQVTNLSLLEYSDFNHPLLRKMILEAPGSYQHSLVVANLAEAAAEAIGANSLLARVGAYYHDIGKISKAEYFVENQMLARYRDRHKKLSPSMSTLIIVNHVKEGIELARRNHLNNKLIEFIGQHHGTTLVYYFYAKAQQQTTEASPEEEVFRYPGPKPQTKEVAIVHLADTIEARSRLLDDPTPSRIKEVVKESIIQKFLDGQLDETDLTLRDLEIIIEVFARIMNAMFHTRVDYSKVQEKNGTSGKQPAESKKDQ